MKLASEKAHQMLALNLLSSSPFQIASFGVARINSPRADFGDFKKEKIVVNFDNNPNGWHKKNLWGTPTLPPSAIPDQQPLPIVVFSGNIHAIGAQLERLGVETYYWAFFLGDVFPTYFHHEINREADSITSNRPQIEHLKTLLADRRSVDILEHILAARQTVKTAVWRNNIMAAFSEPQYFPRDIPSFSLSEQEIFVDAGAFVGDTLETFLSESGSKYGHYHAFEPDTLNYEKLRAFCADKPNISTYPKGLFSRDGQLTFVTSGSDSSRFTNETDAPLSTGNVVDSVDICALDTTVDGPVSYIKMDIEGAELEALKGAEQTIRTHKPKLAICIYHKIHDIWEIPLYIHAIQPAYDLFIRHHSINQHETVLYALPKR